MKTSLSSVMLAFDKAGFRFHKFGTVKQGRKIVADVYIGDALTESTRDVLRLAIPSVTFGLSRCEYAPEIRSSAVFINR